jgi:hypothetical protein
MDTGPMQPNMEGTQEDIMLIPNRNKKMKLDKTGEPQTEWTHNITQRAAQINGKT